MKTTLIKKQIALLKLEGLQARCIHYFDGNKCIHCQLKVEF